MRRPLGAATSGAAFVLLTGVVVAGATRSFDSRLIAVAQSVQAGWLDLVSSLMSVAGSIEITALIALTFATVWTRYGGPRGLAPLLLFATSAIELALKFWVVHPPPPDELSRNIELLPLAHVTTPYAYPSGHMARTTFLATLLWGGGRLRRLALVTLVVLMAMTRLYLGEHWPSDIAGGTLLGLGLGALAAALRSDIRTGPRRGSWAGSC